ncbi:hypothetical protein B0T09DRAFT_378274 [Sordaria sp. MPI-SDFR-AT-0083]|nr:hypothetical protein B0T09DRAFT_378274 [Sordaria sp. MPI-SDFR-AT-0083]
MEVDEPEPTLPPLPVPDELPAFTTYIPGERKRSRGCYAPPPPSPGMSSSSDPAYFSSDDDPALDNYLQGRRKRRYVGSWFDQVPASSDSGMGDDANPGPSSNSRHKRHLKRQPDSGVWVGQDGATDTDGDIDLPPLAARLALSYPAIKRIPTLSSEEQRAQNVVLACVDDGREDVDLSQMGLASISDSVLEPLAGLTPIPVVEKDVPFVPRDPVLKLFLGNNQLARFPSALLDFQHLTVLSLRNNRLTELPPAISKLKNLTTLNIANNRLRHLPGELINLMGCASGLHTLNIHPNPFFQPKHRQHFLDDDYLQHKYECRTTGRDPGIYGLLREGCDRGEYFTLFTTALRARTPVQFSNSAGHVLSKFIFPDMSQRLTESSKQLETEDFGSMAIPPIVKQHLELLGESKRTFRPKGPSSLLATAMRVAARSKDTESLPDMIRADGCPSHLADPLERAIVLSALLLVALPSVVRAVFQDEVGHIDYHHELLGLPQRETTFFHKPRRDDKASLLYTLSDVGVLGAVNPSSGAVLWRQLLNGTVTDGGGFLRAGEGQNWLASAYGQSVHAWDAVNGRNKFWMDFAGEVKDLEIMEMTENNRKDILALFDESESTVLRRLSGNDGRVVWEFKESSGDVPLQISTNVEKVFVISLRGSAGAYNIKVTVLDALSGKREDEMVIGTKADVHDKDDVILVGANSAAPIIAWTDDVRGKLRVSVLGQKTRQEFPLPADTVSVEIHAPHLVQSLPHFLVHSKTPTGHTAEVYHVDLRTSVITKAYQLPFTPGPGAFSTSSNGANVYFTRITDEELIIFSSASDTVLGRWPLKTPETRLVALHGVSEVVKKLGSDSYAVRSAAVTDTDEWILIRNGDVAWSRPEGLTGAVAATFAEIPESENLAKTLEQEAHSNPLEAYIHRIKRHIEDLQYLPAYLNNIPARLMSSVLGTEVSTHDGKLARDSFGFHKLAVLATRRGMIYVLYAGNHGKVLATKRAFDLPKGQKWDVAGIKADDSTGIVTILGNNNDETVVKLLPSTSVFTMEVFSKGPEGTPATQSAALLNTATGPRLFPVGLDGELQGLTSDILPNQIAVVRGSDGELKGVAIADGKQTVSWTFLLPKSQRIVGIATRPAHDAVASIGRVLGDRTVKYKYLNPNTLVVAAVDESTKVPSLVIYLLDTVSGQILSSSKYEGVDPKKHIECAMAENWFTCTYFGQYRVRDGAQSLKGYQIVVSDLYETDKPNDRGVLGDAENFSSLGPIDAPGDVPLPSVVSQTFILSAPISALEVTQTRQGITSRQVLAYLPETHGIVGIPRMVLEPRRPVGRDPTPAEMEEGLVKYHPAIEIDPKSVHTHQRDVIGVQKIIAAPAIVESTSLVLAYGIDVFGSRVAPSFLFDILGKGFNKVTLIGTVLAITAGVMVLSPMPPVIQGLMNDSVRLLTRPTALLTSVVPFKTDQA